MKTRTNWILSCFGISGVILSAALLIATPVFASCSAQVACADELTPATCNCIGVGTCQSSSRCVTCVCQQNPSVEPICCAGGGGEN